MLQTYEVPPLSGNKASSAVILLHGLGADGKDLIGLGDAWKALLPDTHFFAPDAPSCCDLASFGYQWFSLLDHSVEAVTRGVQAAAPIVNLYIDEILKMTQVSPSRLALVGFSQGTMMSLYVAPRREEPIAGILGYSGLLVGGDTLLAEKRANFPVFLSHGMKDEVISCAALQTAEMGLKNAGFDVSCLACPDIGHEIDLPGLEAGGSFLEKILL